MTDKKNRDLSLDFLKGLSILMVVFFHNIKLNPASFLDNLCMLACSAAVPCFFLVSGALFFRRSFSLRRHIQKMARFYGVMVAWRALYLLFYHSQGTPVTGSLRALGSYLFLFQSLDGVETSHFWFMEALLTVMLAAPVFKLCMDGHRKLVWYLIAVLFLFNQLLNDGNLIFALIGRFTEKPAWDVSPFAEVNPFSFRHSNYMLYYLLGGILDDPQFSVIRAFRGLSRSFSSDIRTFHWTSGNGSSGIAATNTQKYNHPAGPSRSPLANHLLMIVSGLAGLTFIKYLQSGTFLWQDLHITSAYYWVSTMLIACGMFLLVTRNAGHLFGGTASFVCPADAAPSSAVPGSDFPSRSCCQNPVSRLLACYAKTVGGSTLGIFYLHIPLIFLFTGTLFERFSQYNGWALNLAESLFIVAVACLITRICRRIPVIRFLF